MNQFLIYSQKTAFKTSQKTQLQIGACGAVSSVPVRSSAAAVPGPSSTCRPTTTKHPRDGFTLRLLTCNGFHFPTFKAAGQSREGQGRVKISTKGFCNVCISGKVEARACSSWRSGRDEDADGLTDGERLHRPPGDSLCPWRWLATLSSRLGRTKRSEGAAAGSEAG